MMGTRDCSKRSKYKNISLDTLVDKCYLSYNLYQTVYRSL